MFVSRNFQRDGYITYPTIPVSLDPRPTMQCRDARRVDDTAPLRSTLQFSDEVHVILTFAE